VTPQYVIVVINIGRGDDGLLNCKAFPDDKYGEKKAQRFFRACVKDMGASNDEVEEALAHGMYSAGGEESYITHIPMEVKS